jgi:hypothetical protein
MGRLWSDQAAAPALESVEQEADGANILGDDLKALFDVLCEAPMPPRLVELVDALELAFQRGELGERIPTRF